MMSKAGHISNPERIMTPANDLTTRFLIPAIAAASCVIVVLTAVQAIGAMSHLRQHVADTVACSPGVDQPADDGKRLIVDRPEGFGCILDLSVLHQVGGSLVVEGQATDIDGSFRVHWAGKRTSVDSANCGGTADLILDGRE